MPIYEFRCRQCGHVFEMRLESRQSSKPQTCPACGETDVDRLWSTFSTGGSTGGDCGTGGVAGFK